jgi:hypothetical protein
MVTALDEKDNICGLCYLYSKQLGVCLLTGDEVLYADTCAKWLAKDTCKGCLIDFTKGDK